MTVIYKADSWNCFAEESHFWSYYTNPDTPHLSSLPKVGHFTIKSSLNTRTDLKLVLEFIPQFPGTFSLSLEAPFVSVRIKIKKTSFSVLQTLLFILKSYTKTSPESTISAMPANFSKDSSELSLEEAILDQNINSWVHRVKFSYWKWGYLDLDPEIEDMKERLLPKQHGGLK